MHGFMCGLDNRTIAYTRRLRVFNCVRDTVAFLTVTVLDAAQDDRKES